MNGGSNNGTSHHGFRLAETHVCETTSVAIIQLRGEVGLLSGC